MYQNQENSPQISQLHILITKNEQNYSHEDFAHNAKFNGVIERSL